MQSVNVDTGQDKKGKFSFGNFLNKIKESKTNKKLIKMKTSDSQSE